VDGGYKLKDDDERTSYSLCLLAQPGPSGIFQGRETRMDSPTKGIAPGIETYVPSVDGRS
jgi:hypothetical protein